MDLKSIVALIPEDRQHPNVSLTAHAARRAADLAKFALSRRPVYLDTRYWIFLRDAAVGRARRQIHHQLLDELLDRVGGGSLLYPIGDSTFFELLRQGNPATRLATARLMDSLSLGVAIQNAHDRPSTELLQFLIGTTVEGRVPPAPIERVWWRVGHVCGTAQPVLEGVDAAEQLALSKSFFDVMWSVTFEETLTDTPSVDDPAHPEFVRSAALITTSSWARARRTSRPLRN